MKRRIRKAKHLIKKYNDSWGSLEYKFKARQLNKDELKQSVADHNAIYFE